MVGNGKNVNVFKESDNEFVIYGSGRKNVQTFSIKIQLVPRQDLLSFLLAIFTGQKDKIVYLSY
jgi:hypothetical protein